MSSAFNAPTRRRKPVINVTPLIDVLFLLLIFFMVSSTFRDDLAIDITLPKAQSATLQEISAKEIAVDGNGVAYFEGQVTTEPELREALITVLEEDPDATLILRADGNANFESVLRVIDIARDLNAANLIIPTDLLEETPAPTRP